jgi:putative membrane protein
MNRYARWAFALALLPVAACSSSPPPVTAAPVPVPPPLASVDQTFVNAAAASDASEIQSSQLAQTKARSARIKTFAAKMVTDHTATTQKLTTIVQGKGATIAATPTDQELEAKLAADKPRAFDRDYINGQIAGHKAAVKVFQDEIDNGQDADLKAFAQTTLPTIKQHLKLAEQIGGHS